MLDKTLKEMFLVAIMAFIVGSFRPEDLLYGYLFVGFIICSNVT